MSIRKFNCIRGLRCVTGTVTVLLLSQLTASADDKKVSAPKPAAKPAAPAPKAAAPRAPGAQAPGHPGAPNAPGRESATTGGRQPLTTNSPHPNGASAGEHKLTTDSPRATTTATEHKPLTTEPARSNGAKTITREPGKTESRDSKTTPETAKNVAHQPVKNGAEQATKRPAPDATGHVTPAGTHTEHLANGDTVSRRSNNRVADVKVPSRNMDIHHGLAGGRRVEVRGRDGSRIVAERGGRGYVQHPYRFHDQEFGRRTYYDHGRVYDAYYRGYPYRGVYIERYAPAYYYPPAYYGWAYNPWPGPVSYAWGWGGNPWFGYYGNYFTPYPNYSSAPLWLTDYLISQSLAAAYQAGQDSSGQPPAAPSDAVALTPEVKDLVSQEVKRQVALENSESGSAAQGTEQPPDQTGIGRTLTEPGEHVFLAGRSIDVVDANGEECAITEGDVLELAGPPAGDAKAADLMVLASKGNPDCHQGSAVSVAIDEMQEMQNHMREMIDKGMTTLHDQSGKNGIPALPPSAQAPIIKAAYTNGAPPPDASAGSEIDQQVKEADKAEHDVPNVAGTTEANAGQPAAPPTVTKEIGLHQTEKEVTDNFGQPTSIRNLGVKKVYVYPNMKVTFTNGKVSDIN